MKGAQPASSERGGRPTRRNISRAVEGLGDHVDAVALAAALEHGRHVPDAVALPAGVCVRTFARRHLHRRKGGQLHMSNGSASIGLAVSDEAKTGSIPAGRGGEALVAAAARGGKRVAGGGA